VNGNCATHREWLYYVISCRTGLQLWGMILIERRRVLQAVAQRIVRLSPERIVRVAIDGVDGAGKTTFADELAGVIGTLDRPIVRASIDGFPGGSRRRGADHPLAARKAATRRPSAGHVLFRDYCAVPNFTSFSFPSCTIPMPGAKYL
jgi:hypothetical protein